MGSNKLHRSMDQGETWETLSGDLTRGGRAGNVPFGTLTTLAEHPERFGQLAVGSDDGLVHVSMDGGHAWTQLDMPIPTSLGKGDGRQARLGHRSDVVAPRRRPARGGAQRVPARRAGRVGVCDTQRRKNVGALGQGPALGTRQRPGRAGRPPWMVGGGHRRRRLPHHRRRRIVQRAAPRLAPRACA